MSDQPRRDGSACAADWRWRTPGWGDPRLAGPLGGLSRASHGALCGSLLPFGPALNESQINDRLRQRVNDVRRWLADGLDVPVDQVWDSLREWSHRAGLGTLRDLGVARDALEPAALAASTSSSMKANPVSLSGEQLLEMLEAAWSERPGIKFCCIMNAPNFICADVQF